MHLGERIKLLRNDRGWQQKELALKLNCPQSTVSMWETQKQEPNPKMRRRICDIFGVTEAELFGAVSLKEPCSVQSAAILTWTQLTQMSLLKQNRLSRNISENRVWTPVPGENIFALEVTDDTMRPEFIEGDIIIITPIDKITANDYFIILDKTLPSSFLRQVKTCGNKTILHPLNPQYPDIDLDNETRHIIIGKVAEKLKKY